MWSNARAASCPPTMPHCSTASSPACRSRFAEIASCGLPDTLVHGDFHPGNFRGTADRLMLLDWGDSGIGHPLLDQPAFLTPHSPLTMCRRSARIGSKAGAPRCRAAIRRGHRMLLAPVAAARQAVIYQKFLDNIEPSEHVYHRNDPADWLRGQRRLRRA